MRVLIVARSLVRQAGVEAMITLESEIQVVGCGSTLAALESSAAQQADAVVLDAALLTEIALEEMAVLVGDLAIAVLMDLSRDEVMPVAQLLQAGVRGILPEDLSAEELVLALEAIAGGLVVLHPALSEDWLQAAPTVATPPLMVPMTPREMEVLQGLATGMANKAIARQLNISEHTVKFHVSSIFSKLSASSRTEAVAVAMRQGLIFM